MEDTQTDTVIHVQIERANTNYCAYSPDAPGCLATGATVTETKERYLEALRVYLAPSPLPAVVFDISTDPL